MTKPLLGSLGEPNASKRWHKSIFAKYGHACHFCGARASDAAHILSRGKLGQHKYASAELGRPLCRSCHVKTHMGDLSWDRKTVREAIKVANNYLKVKLV